ncbi:molybdenum cofactor guanylyltransferase [Arthrobacter sp. H41]|uniref:molybdenum cofactor guanylyltransferase n=1 Tax=Arthrobacter sp. H41 TaxID=1312978 RepID=UPI0004AC7BB4|nr:NTP transferase domain-containing protein [Arthrobacter sp. H41]
MSLFSGGFDAVVLAGGRSSRLGGTPKANLTVQGRSLLEITCLAVADAHRIVVVGPDSAVPAALTELLRARFGTGGPELRVVREDPPFAGPAAALAAALVRPGALDPLESSPGLLAVLACDMPHAGQLLKLLLAAAARDPSVSLVAEEEGRNQPLAALYRRDALETAVADAAAAGGTANLSMKKLLARVRTREVPVPPGTTLDVDTWDDARALGVDVVEETPEGTDGRARETAGRVVREAAEGL